MVSKYIYILCLSPSLPNCWDKLNVLNCLHASYICGGLFPIFYAYKYTEKWEGPMPPLLQVQQAKCRHYRKCNRHNMPPLLQSNRPNAATAANAAGTMPLLSQMQQVQCRHCCKCNKALPYLVPGSVERHHAASYHGKDTPPNHHFVKRMKITYSD